MVNHNIQSKSIKLLQTDLTEFKRKIKKVDGQHKTALEEYYKIFDQLRDSHDTDIEELNDTIISLKQRCTKLQYGSKQGKQNKKKKKFKVEYNTLSNHNKMIYEYLKENTEIFSKEKN